MTENPVTMHEDGVFLRPTVWTTPRTPMRSRTHGKGY